MPRIRDLKRYALWRECIRRQLDSGLTIARFCVRERLRMETFPSWKRRVRLIDLANRHPAVGRGQELSRFRSHFEPPAWLPRGAGAKSFEEVSSAKVSAQ